MMLYDLLKAGHIVAIVVWFGGMMSAVLALAHGSGETMTRFRTWDRNITTPAMLASWTLGLALALWGGWFDSGWMSAKFAFVLALSAIHGVLSGQLRRAAAVGHAEHSPAIRLTMPAMMASLAIIVLLVVTKGF